MRFKSILSAVTGALLLSALGFGSPAQAASRASAALQAEIDSLVKGGAEQIGPALVQWRGGAVVYDLDQKLDARANAARNARLAPAATVHNCPSGYFCFYDAQNYGGRRVQYRDCYEQALPENFTSNVTSWVHNKSSGIVQPYWIGGDILWTEYPNSSSSNVGSANNDLMYGFLCHT